jgi:hypothetical protein
MFFGQKSYVLLAGEGTISGLWAQQTFMIQIPSIAVGISEAYERQLHNCLGLG